MQAKNLPNNLPFLPGNQYADPTITRYHKTQLLNASKDGAMLEKTTSLAENVNPDLLASMREGAPMAMTGMPARRPQENDAIPKIAPKWLKYDRQVLNFDCYFQEPVVESPNENFRVRKCTAYYYLDDDTLNITEKRIENSGITQGIFLKRHQVPNPAGGVYTYKDLNLGMNVDVYGRVFRFTNCDEFTKKFYNNEGIQLNNPESTPDDTFAHTRAMINMKQTPPDEAEQKEYVEVLRGGGNPNKALASFLDNDRKVLSYKILWNDNAYDGGQKFYVMNFFLADNKVEVKEINEQNTGRFPFPMLLKK